MHGLPTGFLDGLYHGRMIMPQYGAHLTGGKVQYSLALSSVHVRSPGLPQ